MPMEELRAYRARLLEQAEEQLPRLREQLKFFGGDELFEPIESGGWSPHQVLVHMRDVEQNAFLPRVQIMLREAHPELPYFDEGRWMEQHYDRAEPLDSLLESFENARQVLLGEVRAADPQGWSRDGRHPTQGIRTVQWWFEYCLQHTEEHLRQLGGNKESRGHLPAETVD
jgi:hypothetical protein